MWPLPYAEPLSLPATATPLWVPFIAACAPDSGPPKAITATAHKLSRIFYRMWKHRQPYKDLGIDYYELKFRERTVRSLSKRAASLGFQLVQLQTPTVVVS